VQARDRTLEALLALVDFPLPEGVVKAEIDGRNHSPAAPARRRRHEQGGLPVGRGADRRKEFDADIDKRTATR
jgi:hypothetical protein